MTIKTALLAGAAAALLTSASAMAQDAPAAAAPAPAAAPQSLTLTPGAVVRGGDGELGKLEGVQTNAEGQQELTVRGADGQVRAVPLAGIRQEGADVAVAYTKAEYDAAAPIAGAAPAQAPASDATMPAPTTEPAAEPTMTEPADPATTTDPMAPPAGEMTTPVEPQA